MIHKTSVIDAKAKISKNVKIGPFCYVGPNVTLKDDVELISNVHIEGDTIIGEGTRIFPFASIGTQPQDLKFKGEKNSIIIGQNWKGDQRIILFIVLNDKKELNTSMKEEIRIRIKQNSTPKHVPSKIIPVKGIPYTISGKKVELAVKKIVEGKKVVNKDSLQNPLNLEYFKNIQELSI